jgi:hypothetical protein
MRGEEKEENREGRRLSAIQICTRGKNSMSFLFPGKNTTRTAVILAIESHLA